MLFLGKTEQAPARALIDGRRGRRPGDRLQSRHVARPSNFPLILTLGVSQLRLSVAEAFVAATVNGAAALALAGPRSVSSRPDSPPTSRSSTSRTSVRLPYWYGDDAALATWVRGKACHSCDLAVTLSACPRPMRGSARVLRDAAHADVQRREAEEEGGRARAEEAVRQGARDLRRAARGARAATTTTLDVALYNRVGDLLHAAGQRRRGGRRTTSGRRPLRRGRLLQQRHRALQQDPAHTRRAAPSVYYKLGKISAEKGFKSDAKQNFLEYADRMQKAGKIDEAFRALKEFADLCPDQDDIRLMLAEQLREGTAQGRGDRAAAGAVRAVRAAKGVPPRRAATIDRMKAIDPAVRAEERHRRRRRRRRATSSSSTSPSTRRRGRRAAQDVGAQSACRPKPAAAPKAAPDVPPARRRRRRPRGRADVAPPSADLAVPRLRRRPPPPACAAGAGARSTQPVHPARRIERSSDIGGMIDRRRRSSLTVDRHLVRRRLAPRPRADDDVPRRRARSAAEQVPRPRAGDRRRQRDHPRRLRRLRRDLTPRGRRQASARSGSSRWSSATSRPSAAPPEHDLALPGELPTLDLPEVRASTSMPAIGDDLELIMPDAEAPARAASPEAARSRSSTRRSFAARASAAVARPSTSRCSMSTTISARRQRCRHERRRLRCSASRGAHQAPAADDPLETLQHA